MKTPSFAAVRIDIFEHHGIKGSTHVWQLKHKSSWLWTIDRIATKHTASVLFKLFCLPSYPQHRTTKGCAVSMPKCRIVADKTMLSASPSLWPESPTNSANKGTRRFWNKIYGFIGCCRSEQQNRGFLKFL